MHAGAKSRERDSAALDKKNHIRKFLAPLFLVAPAMVGIDPASAACNNHAPTTGQTVVCDTSAPNPDAAGAQAAAGSTGVAVNIAAGAGVAVQRVVTTTAVSVDTGSKVTNDGSIILTGGGGSGGNRGAAIVGIGNNNILTSNGSISTTGAFNDGMAANGSGNTLTNNGTITTAGPNAYGMSAAWGQTNTGQANNTLTNNGAVTTSGSNARALSILGQNGVVVNTNTLTTNGSASTVVYMQGNNDRLTNSGIIHATAAGSEGVFSNTVGSSFTATIQNLAGGQIISDQGPALRTLNGATAITNAGLLSSGTGVALNGGNGNISLVLQTGSQIVGAVNGGSGNNQVLLQGTGLLDNAFTKFQTLTMSGTDWTWSGTGDFANTFLQSGNFRLGADLTGNVSVAAGASLLAGNGVNPTILPNSAGAPITVTNAGTIDLTNGGSTAANTLTIAGNYVGAGGTLRLNTVLGTDGSPSDKLVISGAGASASGSTGIAIINSGGAGAATISDGIAVVQVAGGATTAAGSFALTGPVVAGAYEYMLFKGGVGGGNPDNWYLRSAVLVPLSSASGGAPSAATEPQPLPLPGPVPAGFAVVQLIRPEVAVQSVVPDISRTLGLLALGTFHERRGDQPLLDTAPAAWGRVFGQQGNEQYSGGVRPDFNGSFTGFQTGLDLLRFETWNGVRNLVGVSAGQARASGNVSGFVLGVDGAHAGIVDLMATSVGGYWTVLGSQGWYVDMVAQGDFIDGTPRSDRGIGANISGRDFTASIEGGLPIALGIGIALEPQAQFIYQHLGLNNTQDAFSSIGFASPDVVNGRLGFRLTGAYGSGEAMWVPYLKGDVWWRTADPDQVAFGTNVLSTLAYTGPAVEFGAGISGRLTPYVSVYGEGSYRTAVNDSLTLYKGNVGLRVRW
jgi:type V secretory pathway adhesin AidA